MTLQQMKAAGQRGKGSVCPRCGCAHLLKNPVENSYLVSDGEERKRRRICRNCGQEVFVTTEVHVPPGHRAVIVPEEDL